MDDHLDFGPTAWDLAQAIGLGVEPEKDRRALDELADAMLVWAEDEESERLTDLAVEAIWNDELADGIREGLERAAALGPEWEEAASTARAELDRSPRSADVSRAVVQHLAMQLSSADHPWFFCVCCIDEALARTPPSERRELARRVAIVAERNACISEGELRRACAQLSTGRATALLATADRRRAVRARLGRIGRLARTSMPELAAELESLAGEPLTDRPEDDDVWCELCEWMLARVARPELN